MSPWRGETLASRPWRGRIWIRQNEKCSCRAVKRISRVCEELRGVRDPGAGIGLVLVLLSRRGTPEGGTVAVVLWCALRCTRADVPASAVKHERSIFS